MVYVHEEEVYCAILRQPLENSHVFVGVCDGAGDDEEEHDARESGSIAGYHDHRWDSSNIPCIA